MGLIPTFIIISETLFATYEKGAETVTAAQPKEAYLPVGNWAYPFQHGKFVLSIFQAGTVARPTRAVPTFCRVGHRADLTCDKPHGYGVVRQNKFTASVSVHFLNNSCIYDNLLMLINGIPHFNFQNI